MNLGTLIAAAVGAVIGVGSTPITDSVRARRELDQKWLDTKRLVYARFLVALAQAHSRITVTAFRDLSGPERRGAVHEAFHDDPQYSEAKSVLRELAITAPEHVYRMAAEVYESLRIVRDVLAQESTAVDYSEFKKVNDPFFAGLEALQNVMRDDLQPSTRHRHKALLKGWTTRTSEPPATSDRDLVCSDRASLTPRPQKRKVRPMLGLALAMGTGASG